MGKLHQMDLVKEGIPYLQELVNQCNGTFYLGVLEERKVMYLAKEESSQTIRMCSYVGKRAPFRCTAKKTIKDVLTFLQMKTEDLATPRKFKTL